MTRKERQGMRVAIIGAGASGLTAAHTLKRLGYRNITVYEKEERAGGKVHSVRHRDFIFEIGAFWINQYDTIISLAGEYGFPLLEEEADFLVMDDRGKNRSFIGHAFAPYKALEIAAGFMNYERARAKFAGSLKKPGFDDVHPDLFLPMQDFIAKYRIGLVAGAYLPFWVGCGYGYYEDTPALYPLKLLMGGAAPAVPALIFNSLVRGGRGKSLGLKRVPGGFQSLWEAMAEDIGNVRTGREVKRVTRRKTRRGASISVTTDSGAETYDRLIISLNPKTALGFLDATAEEKTLFSRVESYRYDINLVRAEGVPYRGETMIFLSANNTIGTIGRMTALINRRSVPDVWTTGSLIPWKTPAGKVSGLLRDDFRKLGARLREVIYRKSWDYFPHVKTDALRDGFYESLEARQGEMGTYFVGALMNLETVEHTAGYAEALVRKFF